MDPFTTHSGVVSSLDRANVDTDQIIPKQFLKRIERTGFGQFLFWDWRADEAGKAMLLNIQFLCEFAIPAVFLLSCISSDRVDRGTD